MKRSILLSLTTLILYLTGVLVGAEKIETYQAVILITSSVLLQRYIIDEYFVFKKVK